VISLDGGREDKLRVDQRSAVEKVKLSSAFLGKLWFILCNTDVKQAWWERENEPEDQVRSECFCHFFNDLRDGGSACGTLCDQTSLVHDEGMIPRQIVTAKAGRTNIVNCLRELVTPGQKYMKEQQK
jgi:hypothetical protein